MPFLAWLFFLWPQPIFAQNNQTYTDYLYQLNLYQHRYQDYLDHKQTDKLYHNLASQQDLLASTKTAVLSRNLALKTYLAYLHDQLNTRHPADLPASQVIQSQLLAWENWLTNQNTLSNPITADFPTQYMAIQKLISTTRTLIWKNQIQFSLDQVINLITQIKQSNFPQPKLLDDLNLKNQSVITSLNSAWAIVQKYNQTTTSRFNDFYPLALAHLNQARNLLKQSLNDLTTILSKYGE
jgi:hypothetical protein